MRSLRYATIDESCHFCTMFGVDCGFRLQRKALPPPSDNVARSPGSTSGLRAMPAGEMLGNAANERLELPMATKHSAGYVDASRLIVIRA